MSGQRIDKIYLFIYTKNIFIYNVFYVHSCTDKSLGYSHLLGIVNKML